MMVTVRRRGLVWTLAGAAVIAVVVMATGSDGGADGDVHQLAATSTSTTTSSLPQPGVTGSSQSPSPSTTTTTLAPTTTTVTVPPETTTTTVTMTTASGYTWIPKPAPGPATVAPGGALTKHLAADIAAAFGFDTIEVEEAIAAVELPPEALGNPEGWLAPGTYDVAEGASASDVVQAMVDRQVARLAERNIPQDQWYRVLTAASVIEKETYNQNEKPMVARVLVNRLAGGGPLQMDSIILYPVPEDRIFTTSEERASDQPYNSYRHNGLPPTPICAPDEASLDAFLAPPPGDWWFYVTIDLHSGETRFAITYDQHLANVELLRAWLADNPTR